ncbi:TraK family protein [Maridesulfovibrio sp. FT414]|uniref:TraK family protein n=1 Tax=Maridesulfovibrio sp. FT414 TaxID=2979469 RepID=UPI003D8034EF
MNFAAVFSRALRIAQVTLYTSFLNKTKRGCMTSEITPSQRGKGRVEYLSLAKDIEKNLLAGHTKRAIHAHLVNEGRMTISYQRFCHYVKTYSPHCIPAGKVSTPSPSTGVPAIRTVSATRKLPSGGDGSPALQQDGKVIFVHDNNVTKKELDEKLIG